MNKEFIPYKEALELKELGFDYESVSGYSYPDSENLLAHAILYQQAFRWFRDKKLCDGSVCRHGDADGGYSYRFDILCEYGVYEERHFKQGYSSYEEAELACLKKLIELVKQKQLLTDIMEADQNDGLYDNEIKGGNK